MFDITKLPKVKGKYKEKFNLGKICRFNTNAYVDVLYIPRDTSDLQKFLKNKSDDLNIYLIGAGSNIFIRTEKLNGVAIKLGIGFQKIIKKQNQIIVGAGCLNLNVAQFAKDHNISGFEFLVTIPGSVGGSVAMNAGCNNNEIKDILIDVTSINILSGEVKTFTVDDCKFRYRMNLLSHDWIFLEAKFQGGYKKKGIILSTMERFIYIKGITQPVYAKTAGSTFVNPDGYKAWQLIDYCNLRGKSHGGALFSELHCNFILNHFNAIPKDIEMLISMAKERVKSRFGIDLVTEIKILG